MGALETVKELALVAAPASVVTVMKPFVAPAGTVAMIWLSAVTVALAVTPLNCTVVAPLIKFAPEIVTVVPARPMVGEKLVRRGATKKLVLLDRVPPGVVTLICPVRASTGTVAAI